MSTSRESPPAAETQLVTLLSHWLARHVDDDGLRRELAATSLGDLSAEQADAVEELKAELENGGSRGDREMIVRETLEALALGG